MPEAAGRPAYHPATLLKIYLYLSATCLLLTADCGGRNGARVRLWKRQLQTFANETGLSITVAHHPPGTSKWNRIKHQFFAFTTQNWRGYKAHLAGDEESGLIRQAEMSSADLHDSQMGAVLIQGDEEAYYADKAYDSQALRDELAVRGIKDRIAYKARRGKKQPNWQKWMNKVAASVRSGIERTNATLKNWYGMARVRYLGLARNHCHLQLVACALNAKRALVLIKARAA